MKITLSLSLFILTNCLSRFFIFVLIYTRKKRGSSVFIPPSRHRYKTTARSRSVHNVYGFLSNIQIFFIEETRYTGMLAIIVSLNFTFVCSPPILQTNQIMRYARIDKIELDQGVIREELVSREKCFLRESNFLPEITGIGSNTHTYL